MADEEASTEDGRVERLISWAASVVAPLSVLTAVLFYFGYASSRAQFEYFGVDVDTIGLSTQDYVMRSPQALLTPLLVLVLIGVAVAVGHDVFRRRVHAAAVASTDADEAVAGRGRERLADLDRSFRLVELAGWCLLAVGALLLLGYALLQDWTPYPLVTPLVMGLGAGLALFSARVRRRIHPEAGARIAVVLALSLVLVTDVFWATATVAQWSGRGSAQQVALHLDGLPTVGPDVPLPLPRPAPADPGQGPAVPRPRYMVAERLHAHASSGWLGAAAVPVRELAAVTGRARTTPPTHRSSCLDQAEHERGPVDA
jgi:hypothetical protein